LGFRNNNLFCGAGLLVQRPTPNLEDQASVFMTPGDRVAQVYPQALGNHFSRLLRHAWVTVGLSFNPGHHTGGHNYQLVKYNESLVLIYYRWMTVSRVGESSSSRHVTGKKPIFLLLSMGWDYVSELLLLTRIV
jgi:hypothetical protein